MGGAGGQFRTHYMLRRMAREYFTAIRRVGGIKRGPDEFWVLGSRLLTVVWGLPSSVSLAKWSKKGLTCCQDFCTLVSVVALLVGGCTLGTDLASVYGLMGLSRALGREDTLGD